jgi:hypothetical protein
MPRGQRGEGREGGDKTFAPTNGKILSKYSMTMGVRSTHLREGEGDKGSVWEESHRHLELFVVQSTLVMQITLLSELRGGQETSERRRSTSKAFSTIS